MSSPVSNPISLRIRTALWAFSLALGFFPTAADA